MLDQVCREVLVQGGVDFLDQNGVDAMGPASERCAAFRDRNLKRNQAVGTKTRLGFGENARKFENITQLFDGHSGLCTSNVIARRCEGRRLPRTIRSGSPGRTSKNESKYP